MKVSDKDVTMYRKAAQDALDNGRWHAAGADMVSMLDELMALRKVAIAADAYLARLEGKQDDLILALAAVGR